MGGERMGKKLGRPRKIEGVISYKDFRRAGIVMSVYDEVRKDGQKHDVAVRETVEIIKQRYPNKRISETGVRRILAQFRPKTSRIILRFEREILSGEDLARHNWIQEDLAHLGQPKRSEPAPASDGSRTVTVYRIRLCERPNYGRHNRKPPKE